MGYEMSFFKSNPPERLDHIISFKTHNPLGLINDTLRD